MLYPYSRCFMPNCENQRSCRSGRHDRRTRAARHSLVGSIRPPGGEERARDKCWHWKGIECGRAPENPQHGGETGRRREARAGSLIEEWEKDFPPLSVWIEKMLENHPAIFSLPLTHRMRLRDHKQSGGAPPRNGPSWGWAVWVSANDRRLCNACRCNWHVGRTFRSMK